jgi:hypothetical protein
MAKRNTDYVSDPYALGAGPLRNPQLKAGDPVSPAVVGNLRSLIALADARFALIPVELAFAKRGSEARPVVRMVLLDGRMGREVQDVVAGKGRQKGRDRGRVSRRQRDVHPLEVRGKVANLPDRLAQRPA